MRILMFVAAAMAASIALWVATLLLAPAPIDLNSRAALYAMAGIVLAAAAMIGSGVVWWNSRTLDVGSSTLTGTGSGKVERRTDVSGITALAIVAAGILLIAGVVMGEVKPVRAALMLLLGGGALFTILVVVDRLAAGSEVEVSSHWGGLGGSLGGWRISQTAILLIVALLLVSATLVASGIAGEGESEHKNQGVVEDNSATNESGEVDAADQPADKADANGAGSAPVADVGNAADEAANAAANGAAPSQATVSAEGAG